MSIYGAMLAGVSGLAAQSTNMSAISDNIANANTVGYKRTEVPFSTLVTTQVSTNSYSAGGVRANPTMRIDRQGLLLSTGFTTDLAIQGSGFFVVNTAATATTGSIANETLFTRAGSFRPDADGNLRNTAGLYLQGWRLDSAGNFENGEPARTSFAGLETINITGLNFTGAPTQNITFSGNLPANETGQAIPGNPIVTGVEYFDPVGNPQTINMQWTPSTTYGSWTLDLVPSGSSVPVSSYQIDFATSGASSGTPTSITEVPSVVATRDLLTVTDNPSTYTGDVVTIDVTTTSVQTPGQAIHGQINGVDFTYTTVAGDDNPNNLAQNLATYLNGLSIANIASVSANTSGRITITGTNDNAGASIDANTFTLDDNVTVAGAVVSNTGTDPDTFDWDIAGTVGGGLAAGDVISGRIGDTGFSYTLPGAVATDAALATNLAAYLNGLGLANVASVGAAGTTITVTANADPAGDALVNRIDLNTTVTETVDTASGNQPNTLAGDAVQFDMAGSAATFQAGDVITLTLNGYTFNRTVPAGGFANDTALSTWLHGEIVNEATAPGIPGISAGNVTVSGTTIDIVGDTDAAGSGADLAGGAGAVQALTVRRDTTANSIFVDQDGLTITPSQTNDPIITRINLATLGGATQQIDINLGALGTIEGITQFAGDYTPTLIERDGAQFGSLDRVEVGEDGMVSAIFNNGQVRPIYRVPVIDFVNPNGLLPVTGNAFQVTVDAGAYYMWDAGVGPAGTIAGSSLENSTVDIAEEFSNMIIAQRSYSSNARIIQTADEMLQEITNLKR